MDRSSAEPSEHKTSLCSTGVFRQDTQGQGRLNTVTDYYTKPSIWHRSLGNTSSALQGKSLTALTLAGNSPQLWALLYRWPQKTALPTSQLSCCQLVNPMVMWCGGRLVSRLGVKALDSSVERLWFDHITPVSLVTPKQHPQCLLP